MPALRGDIPCLSVQYVQIAVRKWSYSNPSFQSEAGDAMDVCGDGASEKLKIQMNQSAFVVIQKADTRRSITIRSLAQEA